MYANQSQTISLDCIFSYADLSLEILERNPKLAIMRDTKNNNETALHVLARKPSAISSRSEINIWKKRINFC